MSGRRRSNGPGRPPRQKHASKPCVRKCLKDKIQRNNQEENTEHVTEIYHCGRCSEEIESDDNAIYCEGDCGHWYHPDCENLSQEDYDMLTITESCTKWFCGPCDNKFQWNQRESKETREWKEQINTKIDGILEELRRIREDEIVALHDKCKDIIEKQIKDLTTTITGIEEGVRDTKKKVCTSEQVDGIVRYAMEKDKKDTQSSVRGMVAKKVVEEVSKAREKNIIIYRAEEGRKILKEENIQHDKQILDDLMSECKVPGTNTGTPYIEKIIRLGKPEEGKTRPMLIVFKDLDTKKSLFRNLHLLENAPEAQKKLSISHDLSPEEREENRKMVAKMKEMQQNDPEHKYVIRGTPWNREIIK